MGKDQIKSEPDTGTQWRWEEFLIDMLWISFSDQQTEGLQVKEQL